MNRILVGLLSLGTITTAARAAIVIEPDDYAEGALLRDVAPGIVLTEANSSNVSSNFFQVTSKTTWDGYASTGAKVFADFGIDWWDSNGRLRIDFPAGFASSISIDAIGGSFFHTEIGVLQAFGANNQLLATYSTAQLADQQRETMTITRPSADIKFAVAYGTPGPDNFGPFTVLDHLTINGLTATPEPASFAVLSIGALTLIARRRKVA